MRGFIANLLLQLASQVKKSDVTIKKTAPNNKITDDNQSIKDGVINEKRNSSVRSKTKPRSTTKRTVRAKRKD